MRVTGDTSRVQPRPPANTARAGDGASSGSTGGTRSSTRGARSMSGRLMHRIAIAVCAGLLIGLIVTYGMMLRSGNAGIKQTDFIAYYTGARLLLTGHASHVYDFGLLGRSEAHLVYPLTVRNGVLPYVYPPYFALLQAPLAALPYSAAFFLWLIVNCSFLAAAMAALQRYASLTPAGALLFWVAALPFLPLFAALTQGQTSFFMLALLTAAFFAARAHRDVLAGVALGLALVKPPFLVPILIVLLVQRRWRVLTAFVGTALVLAGVPALLFGFSVDQGYLQTLAQATSWHQQFGYGAAWNHSFAGFSQLLLPSPASTALTGMLDLSAVVLLGWCARRSAGLDLPIGLAALVALLISPHVLVHDLALLLLPVAVALRYRAIGPGSLPMLLSLGYLATLVGLRLAFVLPLQLSVIAMSALAVWLLLTARRVLTDRATARVPARTGPSVEGVAP